MSPDTLPCSVVKSTVIDGSDFKRCAKGLATGPEGDTPFLFSYDLRIDGDHEFVEPYCRAWLEHGGDIHSYFIDDDRPDLARAYAPQILSLLAHYDLREICAERLRRINPRARGETYHVCLSAHGVILVAEHIHTVAADCGRSSVFSAFMPTQLSNHAHMACLAGLQVCATALLNNQYSVGSRDKYSAVRIQPA